MSNSEEKYMRYAIELAAMGEGNVEPNPMVGCVLVRDDQIIGHGYHQQFGGPHAEVNALNSVDSFSDPSDENSQQPSAAGATAFVTLEPCSHVGKTGPCCDALIKAEVSKVVVACRDPNPQVAGQGIKRLEAAGIEVVVGLLESKARDVMAPYLKRFEQGKPWVIAKWAMTLDGKIATSTGDSKWISNSDSRQLVHDLRGRVDVIMVGIGTAMADDPMLNARPEKGADVSSDASPRESNLPARSAALRVVVDSTARIDLESNLVRTAKDIPLLIATGPDAPKDKLQQLTQCGCEVFSHPSENRAERLDALLSHLSQQQLTNILVEGGGQLLGSLHDLNQIDEVHCFIGSKIVGGTAVSPVQGDGLDLIKDATGMAIQSVQQIGDDIYIIGRKR